MKWLQELKEGRIPGTRVYWWRFGRICAKCRWCRPNPPTHKGLDKCVAPTILADLNEFFPRRDPSTGEQIPAKEATCMIQNANCDCRYWEPRWEGTVYVTPQGSRIDTAPVPPGQEIRGVESREGSDG